MKLPDSPSADISGDSPVPAPRHLQRGAESEYGRSVSTNVPGMVGIFVSSGPVPHAFTGAEAAFLAPLSAREVQRRSTAVDAPASTALEPDSASSVIRDVMPGMSLPFDDASDVRLQEPATLHRIVSGPGLTSSPPDVAGGFMDIFWSPVLRLKPIDQKQSWFATYAHAANPVHDLPSSDTGFLRDASNASSLMGSSSASASPTLSPRRSNASSEPSDGASEPRDILESSTNSTLDASSMSSIEAIVYTGSAAARLVGNAEDNTLVGSTGNDTLVGNGGDDFLLGGRGNDVFVFRDGDGSDRVIDFATGDRLQLVGLQTLAQVSVVDTPAGQQLRFGTTVIELVGVSGLVPGDDWIISR